ncbi:hypothetical protein JYU34_002987 [Plutella xylostella]|uniref:Uncharacterized protein n=1 Tax=Plutella xylostella TaxID=51655 RepID=A0ABQ7R3L6_PLUXY|nr:hypothetical protein JYU34_002987 [Plutella xylostella]
MGNEERAKEVKSQLDRLDNNLEVVRGKLVNPLVRLKNLMAYHSDKELLEILRRRR